MGSREERIEEIEQDILGGVRAKNFFKLQIFDARHEHVVTLRLKRREEQTVQDLAQLQNYLWTQIGFAIREDPDLRRRLELGGIEVLLEDPDPPPVPTNAS